MRRMLVVGAVVSIMAGVMAAASPAAGVAGFGDTIPGRFYTDAVQWMVDNDITTGTTPTCFSPNDPVTRGQAAAFMWRMEDEPAPGAPHGFIDVAAVWQQNPVSWMVNNDITTGTSPTTYSPEDKLTRGQLAALLHRLAGEPDAPPPTDFPDVVKAWQVTPVGWMVKEGITTGTSPTTFSPEDTVTRGQLATFFHRYKGTPAVAIDYESPGCNAIFVGERLNLFVPPVTSPANVPFHVNHGFGFDGADVATYFATNDPRFDLSVDGVRLEAEEVFSTDVSPNGMMNWVYAFRDGLVGPHTFVGEWYEEGVLTLHKEVTVDFT